MPPSLDMCAAAAEGTQLARQDSYPHAQFSNPRADSCWLSCMFQCLWHSKVSLSHFSCYSTSLTLLSSLWHSKVRTNVAGALLFATNAAGALILPLSSCLSHTIPLTLTLAGCLSHGLNTGVRPFSSVLCSSQTLSNLAYFIFGIARCFTRRLND